MSRSSRVALTALIGAEAWGGLYHLGRTWGSLPEERKRHLPGDELIEHPRLTTDHAITIAAPAVDVWPWLVQMGWNRGGWYTYRWVDRLFFPANPGSASEILPQWQNLGIGDLIPDGPPEAACFYVVELFEPNKMMVLRSWTHLPTSLRDAGGTMEWTWAFYLDEIDGSHTRFHFRVRGNLRPTFLRAMYHAFVVPADFVMGRSLCLGVKHRVESRVATAGARHPSLSMTGKS